MRERNQEDKVTTLEVLEVVSKRGLLEAVSSSWLDPCRFEDEGLGNAFKQLEYYVEFIRRKFDDAEFGWQDEYED